MTHTKELRTPEEARARLECLLSTLQLILITRRAGTTERGGTSKVPVYRWSYALHRGVCSQDKDAHKGHYSMGPAILADAYLETADPSAAPHVYQTLQRYRRGGKLTLEARAALDYAHGRVFPKRVDVVYCLLVDSSDFGPDTTFRSWLAEGIADGMNAADAFDCYEACRATYEWFVLKLGQDDLQEMRELAAQM